MAYSAIGLLALLVLLIENQDILLNHNNAFNKPSWHAYRRFLFAVLIYYIVDTLWGIIQMCELAPLLFADTSLYFVAIGAGVLLWTQYTIVYLEERNIFGRFFMYAGRVVAALTVAMVVANMFVPIMFWVDTNANYYALVGRYVVLVSQILLLLLLSGYALSSVITHRHANKQEERYRTLAAFGLVMATFLLAQLFYAYLPLYSVAYLLGTCLLRATIIGHEKEEYRRELEEARQIAALTEMRAIKRENQQTKAAYKEAMSTSAEYKSVVNALAKDYFDLYYVDLLTDEWVEYGSRTAVGSQDAKRHGTDFFSESRKNAAVLLYTEDQKEFIETFNKQAILHKIQTNGAFICYYRLMVNGVPTYVSLKATCTDDDERHLIIGINNVDAQMRDRRAAEHAKEERKAYMRLHALSGNMVVIYLIDPADNSYTEFSASRGYNELGFATQGTDFFKAINKDSLKTVHPQDLEMLRTQLSKQNVLRAIERDGSLTLDYRLVSKDLPGHVRLKVVEVEEDGKNLLLVGLFDVDAQVQLEQERKRDLFEAKHKAIQDALTGVKNKHAYVEAEGQLNQRIQNHEAPSFALVVCDVNDLKQVNDTQGHKAGDLYIRKACATICNVFKHSPVFRIGGDEFVILCEGHDYEHIPELLQNMDVANVRTTETGNPQIAYGMARFEDDNNVEDVFDRADKLMYEHKAELKRA